MSRAKEPGGDGSGAPVRRTGSRYQLGPFWLWYRADRDRWDICWNDERTRSRCRLGTGVGGGDKDHPPIEAQQALAAHFAQWQRPVQARPDDALVSTLFVSWLREHVAGKADPARYALSVKHFETFFARERRSGTLPNGATVSAMDKALVGRFIAWRRSEGAGGHTISRDLAALRGALNWAWRNELVTHVPFIRDVDPRDKAGPRELVYTQEQVAALLEAAWSLPERRHVHLYVMIALSTLGRSHAILQLEGGLPQIRDGLINFLRPGSPQTSKRRSIVPIAPTLAPWLEGVKGRVIRYRAEIAKRRWRDPEVPEFIERDCADIGKAYEASLIAAGIREPLLDEVGSPVLLPPRRKLGEAEFRPAWKGRGTPNTLRHTMITELHARGVPEAQIETAAGHRGEGTNKRNYRHLRPEYLRELIDAVEGYWAEMDRLTTVHRRYQGGTKIVSIAGARAERRMRDLDETDA
jgi:integrase